MGCPGEDFRRVQVILGRFQGILESPGGVLGGFRGFPRISGGFWLLWAGFG